jgi:hypothetical protein
MQRLWVIEKRFNTQIAKQLRQRSVDADNLRGFVYRLLVIVNEVNDLSPPSSISPPP